VSLEPFVFSGVLCAWLHKTIIHEPRSFAAVILWRQGSNTSRETARDCTVMRQSWSPFRVFMFPRCLLREARHGERPRCGKWTKHPPGFSGIVSDRTNREGGYESDKFTLDNDAEASRPYSITRSLSFSLSALPIHSFWPPERHFQSATFNINQQPKNKRPLHHSVSRWIHYFTQFCLTASDTPPQVYVNQVSVRSSAILEEADDAHRNAAPKRTTRELPLPQLQRSRRERSRERLG